MRRSQSKTKFRVSQPSTAVGYSNVSKTLHWLIALLAFSQLAMGKFFEVEADKDGSLFVWHTTIGLMVLAGIHVLAGLKHHFIDRDDVLRRMLPG